MHEERFDASGTSRWCGHGDSLLLSPDGQHGISLAYEGEPPHGDSYHQATVDGRRLPGLVWGGSCGFSSCSRYFVCSWMSKKWERVTLVVDLDVPRFTSLPEYIGDFRVAWPTIVGRGGYAGKAYAFTGDERWTRL